MELNDFSETNKKLLTGAGDTTTRPYYYFLKYPIIFTISKINSKPNAKNVKIEP